ncbi:MAG: phosphatase PAP2 family protein [Proteobacteria bacterium]|nr:phosphatase PAP2 family protein [Pseudomonadota bacterium]
MTSSTGVFRGSRRWWYLGGLAALIGGTLLWCGTDLDVLVSSLFYTPTGRDRWSLEYHFIFQALYKYGSWPTYFLALISGALLLLSLAVVRLRSWRRRLGVVVLTVLIGPWLLTNLVLKEHWGRPRPRDVKVFGGQYDYRPVWRPGPSAEGPSFPSGHAAMGFGLVGLAFLFRRRRTGRLVAAGAVGYGAFMGLVRVIQGAHFASDVLWSAGVTLGTALVLHDFVFRLPGSEERDRRRHPEWFQGPWRIESPARLGWCLVGTLVVAGVSLGGFLLTRQVKIVTRYNRFIVPAGVERLVVAIEAPQADVNVRLDDSRGEYHNRPRRWAVDLQAVVRYLGPPWHRIRDSARARRRGRDLVVTYRRRTSGLFLSRSISLNVAVNPRLPLELRIKTADGAVTVDTGGRLPVVLGPVSITTGSGRIRMKVGRRAALSGPWLIRSAAGRVELSLRDVTARGLVVGDLRSWRGDVRLTWMQGRPVGGWLVLGVGAGAGDIVFQGRFNPGALGIEVAAMSPGGRVTSQIDGAVRAGPGGVWQWGASAFQGAVVGLAADRGRIILELGGTGQPPKPNQ